MSSMKKSLNVYFLKILSFLIRSTGNQSPVLGARLLSLIWFKVSKPRANPNREAWLRACLKYEVEHRGKTLSVYSRIPASSRGIVLLLHGWSGRWDQLIAIAQTLFEAKFEVIVFDFPSHGENVGGESDVFELSEFLQSVFTVLKLDAPIVICHSAAFLTVSHGMHKRNLNCSKLITINSPARFEYLIEIFREKIGFSKSLDAELWKMVSRRVGVSDAQNELGAAHLSTMDAQNVFVIHDRDDKEVKFSEAAIMAKLLPNSKKLVTSGLGHNRILSNQTVVEEIKSFCTGEINE